MQAKPTDTRPISAALTGKGRHGAFVCRANPMHLGHQAMIGGLIEAFGGQHVVLIGSCNHPTSIRHLFNYKDRADFIRVAHPNARVMPLPDFEGDDETWFASLDDILAGIGFEPKDVAFLGGSREDVEFYYRSGRLVEIINRYCGITVDIAASKVRDLLIGGQFREMEQFIDPRVLELVRQRFPMRWEEVRKK